MKKDKFSALPIILSLVLVAAFAVAMAGVARDSGEDGADRLEDSIRLAAVACYSTEGFYPPNLQYLKDHYGVTVDERYAVFYEVFAENLIPEITVVEVKG